MRCTHNVASPTTIHLHDAPPGIDGPVVHDFTPAASFEDNVPMTPRLVADFAAGFLYVNIHSPNYETGEIRGQMVPGDPPPPPPPQAVAAIPTLSEWAALLLALSLVALAWVRIR